MKDAYDPMSEAASTFEAGARVTYRAHGLRHIRGTVDRVEGRTVFWRPDGGTLVSNWSCHLVLEKNLETSDGVKIDPILGTVEPILKPDLDKPLTRDDIRACRASLRYADKYASAGAAWEALAYLARALRMAERLMDLEGGGE